MTKPKLLLAAFSAEEWTRGAFLENVLRLKKDEFDWRYLHITRHPIACARNVADYLTGSSAT
mgnify:CR=1 FL=1